MNQLLNPLNIKKLAKKHDINGADDIIEEVSNIIDKFESYAGDIDLKKRTTKMILDIIDSIH